MSSVAAMAAETETGKVRSSAAWCRRGGALAGVVVLHGLVIGALMLAPTAPKSLVVTEPSIMGVLVSPETEAVPEIQPLRPPVPTVTPPTPAPLPPVKNAPSLRTCHYGRRHRSLCLLPRPPFRHPRSRLR
jgi:hypothetical protein